MGGLFSKKFDPARDLPDLTGKVAIVTGGNAGIGFHTVQALARKGAKVYMGARSEERARAALARLDAEGFGPGNGSVVWLKLDLGDPRNAQAAAADFLTKETRLDILVNNAARLVTSYAIADPLGIEESWTVNHFSPFVFTRALLPLLTQTATEPGADVRIVNVSSGAYSLINSKVHFTTKDDFKLEYKDALLPSMWRYGATKLGNVLHANELQRRLDAENVPIICISLHPGGTHTDGTTALLSKVRLGGLFVWLSSVLLASAEKGSYTTLFAAAAPAVRADARAYAGAFLNPGGKRAAQNATAANLALSKELWDTTERVLKEDLDL